MTILIVSIYCLDRQENTLKSALCSHYPSKKSSQPRKLANINSSANSNILCQHLVGRAKLNVGPSPPWATRPLVRCPPGGGSLLCLTLHPLPPLGTLRCPFKERAPPGSAKGGRLVYKRVGVSTFQFATTMSSLSAGNDSKTIRNPTQTSRELFFLYICCFLQLHFLMSGLSIQGLHFICLVKGRILYKNVVLTSIWWSSKSSWVAKADSDSKEIPPL